MNPPVLYIANKNYSSWSLRPWLLLTGLGIAFEERVLPFAACGGTVDYASVSPNGLLPCLHDGELRIWDSLAITEYVAERHPQVWPQNVAARAWARSACAQMHSGFGALRRLCGMNCAVRVQLHTLSEADQTALNNDLRTLDLLWQDGLNRWGGPYLAGELFTAADAFFGPVAFRLQSYGLAVSPASTAYAERLRQLPAMQTWYEQALTEPWRDLAHDGEILSVGHIVHDLRLQPVQQAN